MLQVELGGKFYCARLTQGAVKFSGIQAERTEIAPYRAQIYAVPQGCAIKFNK